MIVRKNKFGADATKPLKVREYIILIGETFLVLGFT